MKNISQTKLMRGFFLFLAVVLFVLGCASNKTGLKENQPFNAEESLRRANELIESGDYQEAREILDDIKAKDASQQYAALAKLRIADTYFDDESYEEAVREYEIFLTADPYNKYASYAQYKLAMSIYKQIRTVDISYSTVQRALKEFEKLQTTYPRNPYIESTESRIKGCQRMLAAYEFYVGNFYFKKGAYHSAAQRFSFLINNYPDSMQEPEALYYLGLSYMNSGQNGLAYKTLKKLIEKFPSLEVSNDAKKELASFVFLIIDSDKK